MLSNFPTVFQKDISFNIIIRGREKIIMKQNDERYQLDVKIYLLLYITLHVSGIYMPIFRSIKLYTTAYGMYTYYTTAYGVQHCKRKLCISVWFHFMFFVVLCNMQ